jgi:hypothetical protein
MIVWRILRGRGWCVEGGKDGCVSRYVSLIGLQNVYHVEAPVGAGAVSYHSGSAEGVGRGLFEAYRRVIAGMGCWKRQHEG